MYSEMWELRWAAGFLVHTPCGPLKSGMPESVEMPAPVRAMTRLPSATTARATSMASGTAMAGSMPDVEATVALDGTEEA